MTVHPTDERDGTGEAIPSACFHFVADQIAVSHALRRLPMVSLTLLSYMNSLC